MDTIGTRPAKDTLFDAFARVAASLGSGRRLEILDVLAQAPRAVDDVAAAIEQSVANTSHHLRRLAADGLLEWEKTGRRVVYRLASEEVYHLWRALQQATAAHHDGLDDAARAYVGHRDEMDRIDWDTLQARLECGDRIAIVDVRPAAEFAAGHVDGAISIAPERLDEMLDAVHPDTDVVAYCRGTFCAYADQAVRRLRAAGRTAYRLDGGYREFATA